MAGGGCSQLAGGAYAQLEPEWVDEFLLAGPADEVCLYLAGPVTRAELGRLVADRHRALAGAGLRRGGAVALHLAPSLAFITNLLASWQIGAQASLLDHRLTPYEVDRGAAAAAAAGRGHRRELGQRPAARLRRDHRAACATYPGQPAATTHAVIQLSSGSTGPSKIIARDAANLVEEVKRYTMIDGVPAGGERIVSLASMVHVLGLVGGLLYSLHAGREPDDPVPDDRGRHPVHGRRQLPADHAAGRPLPHRAAGLGAAAAGAAAAHRHDHWR